MINTRPFISKSILSICLFICILFACNKTEDNVSPDILPTQDDGVGGELIFQTGFGGTTGIVSGANNQTPDLTGKDTDMEKPNDWVEDLDNHPNVGFFRFYYEDGNDSQRYVKVIDEPGNTSNKVLHFWLSDVNIPALSKGRVQSDIYDCKNLKEIFQSVRVYLHPDFLAYKDFNKVNGWMTILEFWNNKTWDNAPNPFRVSMNLKKTSATVGSEIYFDVHAQTYANASNSYTYIWEETNLNIPVPIGKWFTMTYYFKEGDKNNGRFYLAITVDGGSKQVVFDIKNFTHHPNDNNPDGLSDFNPLKLYTSAEMINFMKSKNKVFQIYYDNLKIWKNRTP